MSDQAVWTCHEKLLGPCSEGDPRVAGIVLALIAAVAVWNLARRRP
jgi:hypothetical protein